MLHNNGVMRALIHVMLATILAATATAHSAYINAHNAKRALHCDTPNVAHSNALAAAAQAYADTCPTGHSSESDRPNSGENLYWVGSSAAGQFQEDTSYTSAADSWYAEIDDYDMATGSSKPDATGAIGHFTQMVWKSSVEVGCGVNLNCNNKFGGGFYNSAVVCRYSPPGNWVGEYTEEVGTLIASGGCTPSEIAETISEFAVAVAVPQPGPGDACSVSNPCASDIFCNFDFDDSGFCEACSNCTSAGST